MSLSDFLFNNVTLKKEIHELKPLIKSTTLYLIDRKIQHSFSITIMCNTHSSDESPYLHDPASVVRQEQERQKLEEIEEMKGKTAEDCLARKEERAERIEAPEVAKLNRMRDKLARLNRGTSKFARLEKETDDKAYNIRVRRDKRQSNEELQYQVIMYEYEKRKRALEGYMRKKRSSDEERVGEMLIQNLEKKIAKIPYAPWVGM